MLEGSKPNIILSVLLALSVELEVNCIFVVGGMHLLYYSLEK